MSVKMGNFLARIDGIGANIWAPIVRFRLNYLVVDPDFLPELNVGIGFKQSNEISVVMGKFLDLIDGGGANTWAPLVRFRRNYLVGAPDCIHGLNVGFRFKKVKPDMDNGIEFPRNYCR